MTRAACMSHERGARHHRNTNSQTSRSVRGKQERASRLVSDAKLDVRIKNLAPSQGATSSWKRTQQITVIVNNTRHQELTKETIYTYSEQPRAAYTTFQTARSPEGAGRRSQLCTLIMHHKRQRTERLCARRRARLRAQSNNTRQNTPLCTR